MRLALLVAYDGTDYAGYQRQPPDRGPTIQGTLEAALARLSGSTVSTVAAGRTDAGVHAAGQVVTATVERPARFSPADWQRALNAVLPASLAIRSAAEVAESVNARRAALERTYRYRVLLDAVRDPLRERYTWRVAESLDLGAMEEACQLLQGEHDFAAFGHSPEDQSVQSRRHTVRNLRMVWVTKVGDELWFDFAANAFLTGMVRRLAGTLVLVGRGRFSPAEVAAIREARRLDHPGIPAPASGLCLMQVSYPPGTIVWPANNSTIIEETL
jgi:tRNA pseudouridine38-40 synthase